MNKDQRGQFKWLEKVRERELYAFDVTIIAKKRKKKI